MSADPVFRGQPRWGRARLLVSTALAGALLSPAALKAELPGNYTAALGAPTIKVDGAALDPGVASPANGDRLTVDLKDDKTILNWGSFNITGAAADGSRRSAVFSGAAGATVLNRVSGAGASMIDGHISADGIRFWLVNGSGIAFGPNGSFGGGSLVLSTAAITDAEFGGGTGKLTGAPAPGTAGITLQAGSRIDATGSVLAMAQQVTAGGAIAGNEVALVAATDISFPFAFGSPLAITVTKGTALGSARVLANGTVDAATIRLAGASMGGATETLLQVDAGARLTASAANGKIVLAAGTAADGVVLAPAVAADTAGLGNIAVAGTLASGGTAALAASGGIALPTGAAPGSIAGTGGVSLAAGGAIALVNGTVGTRLEATGGAVSLTAGGDIAIGDVGSANSFLLAAPGNVRTGAVQVTGADQDIAISTTGAAKSVSVAGDLTATRDVLIDATGTATVAEDVAAGRTYRVSGATVALGDATVDDGSDAQSAAAGILIRSSGAITGGSALGLATSTDGSRIVLDAGTGIALGGATIAAGSPVAPATAYTGTVGVKLAAGDLALGTVSAHALLGVSFAGGGPPTLPNDYTLVAQLVAPAAITLGTIDLVRSFTAQTSGGAISADSIIVRAGDLTLRTQTPAGTGITAGSLAAFGTVTASAAGDVAVTTAQAGQIGAPPTTTQDVLVTGGGTATLGTATAARHVEVQAGAAAAAKVTGAVTAGNRDAAGHYQVTGGSVTLGDVAATDAVVQQAAAGVTITAQAGKLEGLPQLRLQANSDGSGTEALALSQAGGGGIAFGPGTELVGGTRSATPAYGYESDVAVTAIGAGQTLDLDLVHARTITLPATLPSGDIVLGDITTDQSLSLRTTAGSIRLRNVASLNGGVTLRASADLSGQALATPESGGLLPGFGRGTVAGKGDVSLTADGGNVKLGQVTGGLGVTILAGGVGVPPAAGGGIDVTAATAQGGALLLSTAATSGATGGEGTILLGDGRAQQDVTLTNVARAGTIGSITAGTLTAGGNVTVAANGTATVAGAVGAGSAAVPGGFYHVSGSSVALGTGVQAARGDVAITATTGTITGGAGLTLASDADATGGEALVLRAGGAAGIQFDPASFLYAGLSGAAPSRTGDIGIRLDDPAATLTLGTVAARSLQGLSAALPTLGPASAPNPLTVGGDVRLLGPVDLLSSFALTSTSGNISTASIRIGEGAPASLTLTALGTAAGKGRIDLNQGIDATGDIGVDAQNTIRLVSATTTRGAGSITLRSRAGDITGFAPDDGSDGLPAEGTRIGTISGGSASVVALTSGAQIDAIDVSGSVDVQGGGDVRLGSATSRNGNVNVGAGGSLTGLATGTGAASGLTGPLLTTADGANSIRVTAEGASSLVRLGTVNAGQDVRVTAPRTAIGSATARAGVLGIIVGTPAALGGSLYLGNGSGSLVDINGGSSSSGFATPVAGAGELLASGFGATNLTASAANGRITVNAGQVAQLGTVQAGSGSAAAGGTQIDITGNAVTIDTLIAANGGLNLGSNAGPLYLHRGRVGGSVVLSKGSGGDPAADAMRLGLAGDSASGLVAGTANGSIGNIRIAGGGNVRIARVTAQGGDISMLTGGVVTGLAGPSDGTDPAYGRADFSAIDGIGTDGAPVPGSGGTVSIAAGALLQAGSVRAGRDIYLGAGFGGMSGAVDVTRVVTERGSLSLDAFGTAPGGASAGRILLGGGDIATTAGLTNVARGGTIGDILVTDHLVAGGDITIDAAQNVRLAGGLDDVRVASTGGAVGIVAGGDITGLSGAAATDDRPAGGYGLVAIDAAKAIGLTATGNVQAGDLAAGSDIDVAAGGVAWVGGRIAAAAGHYHATGATVALRSLVVPGQIGRRTEAAATDVVIRSTAGGIDAGEGVAVTSDSGGTGATANYLVLDSAAGIRFADGQSGGSASVLNGGAGTADVGIAVAPGSAVLLGDVNARRIGTATPAPAAPAYTIGDALRTTGAVGARNLVIQRDIVIDNYAAAGSPGITLDSATAVLGGINLATAGDLQGHVIVAPSGGSPGVFQRTALSAGLGIVTHSNFALLDGVAAGTGIDLSTATARLDARSVTAAGGDLHLDAGGQLRVDQATAAGSPSGIAPPLLLDGIALPDHAQPAAIGAAGDILAAAGGDIAGTATSPPGVLPETLGLANFRSTSGRVSVSSRATDAVAGAIRIGTIRADGTLANHRDVSVLGRQVTIVDQALATGGSIAVTADQTGAARNEVSAIIAQATAARDLSVSVGYGSGAAGTADNGSLRIGSATAIGGNVTLAALDGAITGLAGTSNSLDPAHARAVIAAGGRVDGVAGTLILVDSVTAAGDIAFTAGDGAFPGLARRSGAIDAAQLTAGGNLALAAANSGAGAVSGIHVAADPLGAYDGRSAASTVAGAATITTSGGRGDVVIASALVAGGDIAVASTANARLAGDDAVPFTGHYLQSTGGDVAVTAGGDISGLVITPDAADGRLLAGYGRADLRAASATGAIRLAAPAGIVQAGTLLAGVGTTVRDDDQILVSAAAIDATDLRAVNGNLHLTTGAGELRLASGAAGTGATLQAATNARVGTLTSGGDMAVTALDGDVTGLATTLSPAGIADFARARLASGADAAVRADLGKVLLGSAAAAGNLTVDAGWVDVTTATAGEALALTATADRLYLDTGTAGTMATLTKQGSADELRVTTILHAGGDVAIGSSTDARLASIISDSGTIRVAAAGEATGSSLLASGGDVGVTAGPLAQFDGVTASGAIGVAAGTTLIGNASAGGALALTATSGRLALDTGSAGTTATLTKRGTSDELAVTTSLDAGGAVAIASDSNARLVSILSRGGGIGVAAAGEATGGTLLASGGDIAVDAGTLAQFDGLTASGAIGVTAGTTLIGTADAGGALALTAGAGRLALDTGTAGITATLTKRGTADELAVTTSLDAGGAVAVASDSNARLASVVSRGGGIAVAAAGEATGTTLRATGGDLGVTAGTLARFASVAASGAIGVTGGTTLIDDAVAGGALALTATADQLTLASGTAGGAATLDKRGDAGELRVTGSLTAAGAVSVASTTNARLAAIHSGGAGIRVRAAGEATDNDLAAGDGVLTAGGGDIDVAAGTLASLTRLSASGAIGITAGATVIRSASAGGALALTATAGQLTLDTGTAGTTSTLIKQGSADELRVTTSLRADGDVVIASSTNARLASVTSDRGSVRLAVGGEVTGGTLQASNGDLAIAGGPLARFDRLGASGAIGVTAGSVLIGNAAAGSALALTGTSGRLALDTGTAGTTATLTKRGSGDELAVLTALQTGGDVSVVSDTSARLASVVSNGGGISVRAADEASGTTLRAGAGDLGITAGALARFANVAASGAITVGAGSTLIDNATAGGPLALTATAAQLTLGTGTAGGTATLVKAGGGGVLAVTRVLDAGGAVTVTSATDARLAAVTSRGGGIAVRAAGDARDSDATAGDGVLLARGGTIDLTAGSRAGFTRLAASGAINASGASIMIGTADAGTALALTATSGQLTLGTGTAGRTATLTKQGGTGDLRVTGSLTAGGAVAVASAADAALARVASTGAGITVQAAGNATDNDLAAKDGALTAAADIILTAGGNVAFTSLDARGAINATAATATFGTARAGGALALTATAGQLTLGTGSAGTTATLIKQGGTGGIQVSSVLSAGSSATLRSATDVDLPGTVTAPAITIENSGSLATILGNDAPGAGFALSTGEIRNLRGANVVFLANATPVTIGDLSVEAATGTTALRVLGTGTFRLTGGIANVGKGARILQIGGDATPLADGPIGASLPLASRIAADVGGKAGIDWSGGTLDLRGRQIVFGNGNLQQQAGNDVAAVAQNLVANSRSELFFPTGGLGGRDYLTAGNLQVSYSQYALFQNSGPSAALPQGVVLGANDFSTSRQAIELRSLGTSPQNSFALFGTINGFSQRAAGLLPSTVIVFATPDGRTARITQVDSRINGCVIGSPDKGCLVTDVPPPQLQLFDERQVQLFGTADDLVLPFDALVGTNNDALLGDITGGEIGASTVRCPTPDSPDCPTQGNQQ